ncbi:MAG TPA: methanogenesis marker 2 protein [Methanothermococcus okinawensis]|uniref:Methanogenesis marker 2 protein n=1 Tax=Methanothermococcus okinawensis TaxID=155863 RepID=A0A832ZBE3_9EURY|nr:methanogenesis marker 2 protein [Methanococcaceae archaeon]HIP84899.1 methanogenesis marker 2 protein [Methanothermococcus okinawensis]HIP91146.1 methanogenesis marker 2 protein [Methanothermococcus okinawensis]
MKLKEIVEAIKNFEGVIRKRGIKEIVSNFKFEDEDYNFDIIASFGEDAAVIGIKDKEAILLAADGIWDKVLEVDPWWAGYCSVLVNANDIAAMGGRPIAMTSIIGVKNWEVCREVLKGIRYGIDKFGIPMVGGHTHPDAKCNVLDVSITGIVNRDSILRSDTAKVGDKIVFAYDLEGKVHEKFNLNWDTTTMKPKKLVRDQLRTLEVIGREKLANSCKDISNPGALGTLGMLLEVSRKGGYVDIRKIPKPENIPLVQWLKMYPGCGFVFTTPEEKVKPLKEILEDVNITAQVCGEVVKDRKLVIGDGKEKEVLFDFEKEYICGC